MGGCNWNYGGSGRKTVVPITIGIQQKRTTTGSSDNVRTCYGSSGYVSVRVMVGEGYCSSDYGS